MKVIILGGFLGSGKTTVILQLAKYLVERSEQANRVVILENEIGAVGVDDMLLRGSGYKVSELFSGCACCSMAGELRGNVRLLKKEMDPEWLLLEATGLAYPGRIKETLDPILEQPAHILTVVDAQRLRRILMPAADLVDGQLECADHVLINKIDLVDESDLPELDAIVRERCPGGTIDHVNGLLPIEERIWQAVEADFS